MFHLKNFYQLFKLHLYLNRKLAWCLIVGYGLLALLFATTMPQFSAAYSLPLFVGGALITASAFHDLHDSKFSIQALTLPCTSLERYLALWFLTGPFYLFAVTVIYGIGMGAHLLTHSFLVFSDGKGFLSIAIEYLCVNAFFLFGSIYFKRLPLVKTILILLALSFLFALLKAWLLYTSFYMLDLPIIRQILWGIFAVLIWYAGFLKLQKIELK